MLRQDQCLKIILRVSLCGKDLIGYSIEDVVLDKRNIKKWAVDVLCHEDRSRKRKQLIVNRCFVIYKASFFLYNHFSNLKRNGLKFNALKTRNIF